MMEMFIKTLMKNINIEEILKNPQVMEYLAMAKQVATDFKAIRDGVERSRTADIDIAARLDKLERVAQILPVKLNHEIHDYSEPEKINHA